jgi:hypothetical protein
VGTDNRSHSGAALSVSPSSSNLHQMLAARLAAALEALAPEPIV